MIMRLNSQVIHVAHSLLDRFMLNLSSWLYHHDMPVSPTHIM